MKLYKKNCITCIVIFTILFISNSIEANAASIFIQSEDVPVTVIETAKNKWESYLENMLYLNNGSLSKYYLGQPFTIKYPTSTTYNFPIIEKEKKKITYLLQIEQGTDGLDSSVILSQAIANKLETLSTEIETTVDKSIALTGLENNVYYQFQNNLCPLLTVEHDSDDADVGQLFLEGTHTSDITEEFAVPKKETNRSMMEFDHKVLPWTIYELQGKPPWCEYFVIAATINNQAKTQITSASKLIHGVFPNATDTQLLDPEWITKTNLFDTLNYVNKNFGLNIKFEANTIPFSKVKNEISNNASIIVDLKSDTTYSHAINLIGYTAPKNGDIQTYPPYYYYWNPWWNETFMISSTSEYMKLGAANYKWFRTQYNFRYK